MANQVLAPAALAEIEKALNAGDRVTAVKLYRTATGAGLKPALETVAAIAAAQQHKAKPRNGSTDGH